jgi:hypothetical protein
MVRGEALWYDKKCNVTSAWNTFFKLERVFRYHCIADDVLSKELVCGE